MGAVTLAFIVGFLGLHAVELHLRRRQCGWLVAGRSTSAKMQSKIPTKNSILEGVPIFVDVHSQATTICQELRHVRKRRPLSFHHAPSMRPEVAPFMSSFCYFQNYSLVGLGGLGRGKLWC